MSWSTLEAEADTMRTLEGSYFGTKDASEVVATKKSIAKEIMLRDVCEALHIATTDTTAIDTLVTDYTTDLQRALAMLQLHYAFTDDDAGADSANRYKAKYWKEQYDREKLFFGTMHTSNVGAVTTSVQSIPHML